MLKCLSHKCRNTITHIAYCPDCVNEMDRDIINLKKAIEQKNEIIKDYEQVIDTVNRALTNRQAHINTLRQDLNKSQDKLHKRNVQIKRLQLDLRYEKEMKERFNLKLIKVAEISNQFDTVNLSLNRDGLRKIKEVLNR